MTRNLYPQPDDTEDETSSTHPSGEEDRNHPQDTKDSEKNEPKSEEPRLLEMVGEPSRRELPAVESDTHEYIGENSVTETYPSIHATSATPDETTDDARDNTTDSTDVASDDATDEIRTIDADSPLIKDLVSPSPDTTSEAVATRSESNNTPDRGKRSSVTNERTAIEETSTSTEDRPPESEKPPIEPATGAPRIKFKHKTALWLTVPVLGFLLGSFIVGSLYPEIVTLVSRALTTVVLVVFVIFIALGVLIVLGLKDQARTLLSLILEGGVKYIDFAQKLSELWDDVIKIVQEFILLISPFLAIFLSALFYYIVMFSFRAVGSYGDVTIFTIILTVILASITAGLGQIKIAEPATAKTFRSQFSVKFGRMFIDGIEIAVLLIFLTIDIPNLFFLPESLRHPIEAQALGFDFMKRGISSEGLSTTFRIAGAAVFIEVIRKIYRLIVSIRFTYKDLRKELEEKGREFASQSEAFETLKKAVRMGIKTNLDDFIKFIAFTTILTVAFFLFPRLKLLSLLVFNITNLAWDIAIPARVTRKGKSEDLLSRLIVKWLKLEQ